MDYPNLSFHVHQMLTALHEISNHLLYLPDPYKQSLITTLAGLQTEFSEMVAEIDLQSDDLTLSDQYSQSDKTTDMAPFVRTETVEFFDNYIALDADGRFTYANPAAFTIFGRPYRNLQGENIWEVLPELRRGRLYPAFQAAVSTRQPTHLELDGINDRCFSISIHPTHKGVILYWLDITEKKNIEAALRASEERLRAAIETAPINVFTLDKNLRYVWIGVRRDGFFHEPVLGKRADELLPAQDASILLEAEQYVLDTGQGQRKEVRFQKNGKPVIYTMAIEPLFDSANSVVGLTVAVMDVTEQRRLEAERKTYADQLELQRSLLKNSEQERLELARNLHDGPIQRLAGLGFSLQIIKETLKKDRMSGDAAIDQMAVDIQNSISELRDLCNDLRPPVLSRFGLRKALLEHSWEVREKHPHLHISLEFPDDFPVLSEQLSLALYRIYHQAVSNVIRHAEASQICVRLEPQPQQIHLEVEDNGSGFAVPLDWLELARGGHLGLVGMKERAETAGGTLQVISQSGQGTLVRAILPV